MTTRTLTIEALSVASLAHQLDALPHETHANIIATEKGTPWAYLDISPLTDTARAIFPQHPGQVRGDTSKQGQAGVMHRAPHTPHSLHTVINRAARMARA